MARPISDLVVTQTFQNWFDKTNEISQIIRSNALTASVSGDSTTGNATLVGTFTANTFVGNFSSDSIGAATNGGSITFTSPTIHNALADGICATFTFGDGGLTRYTDGSVAWDVGMEDSQNANFIIDTGVAPVKFSLSPAGTLTVPNITTSENLSGNNAVLTNDVTAVDVICENLFANNINFDGTITGDIDFGSPVDIDGNLTVDGDGRFTGDVITNYSISDIRLKENIEPIDDALGKVNQVGGYTFNYIERPDERVSGVIAQEIEKVLPGVVYEVNEEGFKGVRYDNIIPLLIQAIKELSDKVEKLENKN